MTARLTAALIETELRRANVTWAVSVPDWVQLPLYRRLQHNPDVSVVPTCAEDEAVAVAAGLSLTGAVPVVLIQNQGFYAAVNNIRAITLDGDIPMVFVVGQFGLEAARVGEPFSSSGRRVVRMLPRLLDAMDLPWRPLDDEADLAHVEWAFAQRDEGRSAVLVVSRNLAWEGAA